MKSILSIYTTTVFFAVLAASIPPLSQGRIGSFEDNYDGSIHRELPRGGNGGRPGGRPEGGATTTRGRGRDRGPGGRGSRRSDGSGGRNRTEFVNITCFAEEGENTEGDVIEAIDFTCDLPPRRRRRRRRRRRSRNNSTDDADDEEGGDLLEDEEGDEDDDEDDDESDRGKGVFVCRDPPVESPYFGIFEEGIPTCVRPDRALPGDDCGCCGMPCPEPCSACPCEFVPSDRNDMGLGGGGRGGRGRGNGNGNGGNRTIEGVEVLVVGMDLPLCVPKYASAMMVFFDEAISCNTECESV